MANWAYVQDDKIDGLYELLPKSWRNISGLRNSADDPVFLQSLGWLPVVKQHQQEYDKQAYVITGYHYELENGIVIETLTLGQTVPQDQIHRDFMVVLRQERDQRLTDSDWTQLGDAQLNLSALEKYQWRVYRKELRDLTKKYEENELMVNLDQVEWPVIVTPQPLPATDSVAPEEE